MTRLYKHIGQAFLAGIVAILPIAGLIITVAYLESTISSTGISKIPFYFPGFGLLTAVISIYLVGLIVTNFIGKWIWKRVDKILNRLPALGRIYQTLKQILGYGEGEDAIFHEVVLVPSTDQQSEELGLVTNKMSDDQGHTNLIIFVPGAPSPTSGRLLVMRQDSVKRLAVPVNEAIKALVSMGKTEIDLRSFGAPKEQSEIDGIKVP
ncbi:hypothetical protein LCGC14_2898990 [marine sediment metagenome]|uniref:DUF502 domain-containing protein n=1 Tax=marine sediment metagenome TaxID=412755 RepID=A0A0F8XV22_9ZZZZ